MPGCSHRWVRHYEECLLGGCFPSGYKCKDCDEFVPQIAVGPNMGGVVLDEQILFGPHGAYGRCADGSLYKQQIWKDGKLEIIR